MTGLFIVGLPSNGAGRHHGQKWNWVVIITNTTQNQLRPKNNN